LSGWDGGERGGDEVRKGSDRREDGGRGVMGWVGGRGEDEKRDGLGGGRRKKGGCEGRRGER
jgi:hypothetical protein